ncbi:hypothetical protein V6N13_111358 [Hibiscus sabdariffa]|uniref:Uncharacterized protein n=1 Tax=Hibiscus sabdariffa TaxID=183260 RepID=A0ABR2TK65_9ROSI
MLVAEVILQMEPDAMVRRKQALQFLLSLVERCHGKRPVPIKLTLEYILTVKKCKKEMSGGTPVAGGSMRQRHGQGYASCNEDLEDDACSRLQPFSHATPRARTWTEILENVLTFILGVLAIPESSLPNFSRILST